VIIGSSLIGAFAPSEAAAARATVPSQAGDFVSERLTQDTRQSPHHQSSKFKSQFTHHQSQITNHPTAR
jgi:hypothetical protein